MGADMRGEAWLVERYRTLRGEKRLQYALISLKIKRFRIFKRLYGKETADELIEKVYEAISGWLGPEEYVARIHLNYYNLLVRMPRDYEGIFQRVISLNRAIRDMPDQRFHGQVFSGMGVYPLTAEAEPFDVAQYNADICRVECPERDFRNSHMEVYGYSYHDPNLRYFDLQQMIGPALERHDFKLYLQPKVDPWTGEVKSAEALVRWIDPDRGMIPVGDFLPALEENGLIEALDLYLFEEVCKLINHWVAAYGKKIRISVNLSGCAFNYLYFFDDYKKIYEKYQPPKECIEFELLESIVLNKVERVRQVVEQLRAYGFDCSLDDFGSGFSSYGVLTTTRISALKIDRSLFRDASDPRERILLRHIVQTAHELNMTTVAEGVECMEHVAYMRELGCELIQGFVFYRPMEAAEFERRFVRGNERARVES